MFGFSKQIVLRSKSFIRKLPENLALPNTRHFDLNREYHCPDVVVYTFPNVSMLPDSTLFLYGVWPLRLSFPYFKGRIRHHSVKGVIDIQRSWKHIDFEADSNIYLVIHDQWTSNYYHWMTQALPRLLLARATDKTFTLLLPDSHQADFHIRSLHRMGITRWITFPVAKTYCRVRNLMYPSHDIQIGDYNDELIRRLPGALAKRNRKGNGIYIFIQRASLTGRKILNEAEVIATFLSWGFEIICFETLSFEDQIEISSNASILAGVHGAGLTNMLFMDSGSIVFELTSSLKGEQYYYYTLSNALGHRYFYQLCLPDDGSQSIQEANVFVDIELLNRNLERMTK